MIHIKSEKELERMRVAGRITALARKAAADAVHPGVTTEEIDRIVRKTIEDAGAKPSFLGYGGFPGSACAVSYTHLDVDKRQLPSRAGSPLTRSRQPVSQ